MLETNQQQLVDVYKANKDIYKCNIHISAARWNVWNKNQWIPLLSSQPQYFINTEPYLEYGPAELFYMPMHIQQFA